MKRTSLLLALVFIFSLTVSAGRHSRKSTLELRLWDHERFTVVIDHHTYPANVRNFKIDNLQPGDHFIKVIKTTQRHNGFITQVVFRGKVYIKGSSIITAKITRHHKFDILSVRPKRRSSGHSGYNGHHGQNSHGSSHGVNSHSGHSQTGINSHTVSSDYGQFNVMSDYSFAILKETMLSSSFDSKRLEIAKSVLFTSTLCSEQVFEMMEILTFESNRLELAKFGYTSVTDPENYFLVHRAFVFGSSISELNHYIYAMDA